MAIKTIKRLNDTHWHRWFAWYPVTFNHHREENLRIYTRAWLKTIEQRRVPGVWYDAWEYRLIKPD